MKTAAETLKGLTYELGVAKVVDADEAERVLDEYAEEYAKAFYTHVIYKMTGYRPDPEIVDSRIDNFKESQKK